MAWDAVPLTVRGLNKAVGNPPLINPVAIAQDSDGLLPVLRLAAIIAGLGLVTVTVAHH